MFDRSCDVVIATRNRPAALARCLEGLRHQTVEKFGVIVVDDHSEPPITGVVAAAAGDLDVRVIVQPAPSGPAAARNAGVAASLADFVVFLDDDIVPNRTFLATHLDAVTADEPSGAPLVSCGPFVEPADWDPTPWNRWEARQARKEADHLARGDYDVTWRQFHTGNNCVPRAAFEAVGGFDESFRRAEDDELALRLHRHGCVIRYVPDAIAWHYSHRSLDAWLQIPAQYAHYDVELDRRYPELGFLAQKRGERARRRWPLRAARRALAGERRARVGVAAAVTAGRVLDRFGATGAAMGALSVAYDVTYERALLHRLAEDETMTPC